MFKRYVFYVLFCFLFFVVFGFGMSNASLLKRVENCFYLFYFVEDLCLPDVISYLNVWWNWHWNYLGLEISIDYERGM